MKRVFAAIDISEEARRGTTEYISRLRKEFPDSPVRWERPEKLHVTLKFAGSLDETQLAIFTARVAEAAKSVNPFRMRLVGAGAFIKRCGPSVLWLGIEIVAGDRTSFELLGSKLGDQNKRPFKPHITIARIGDAKKAKVLIDRHLASHFEPVEFDVNELVIYESTLLPSGSVYAMIASFSLAVKYEE